ncbi:unnamed protein product [Anisakis simplex]|uniref:Syndetin n=1 Tax=Anisakis simplex TaxID=6269 RepID=A0A0M3JRN5_ANISI|nr:unnamed protein product [Anisakis simplex]
MMKKSLCSHVSFDSQSSSPHSSDPDQFPSMESMDNVRVVRDLSTASGQGTSKAKLQTRCLPTPDPVRESEILESIDAAYYIDDGFDATDYELKKMIRNDLLPVDITREMERLKRQLQVVSKRISAMILENSPSYSAQLKHVDDIHSELADVLNIVMRIRGLALDMLWYSSRNLGIAKSQSRNGLQILANHRNKIFLRHLKNSLRTVKTLYETEFQLKDLIQEGNFPDAIRLCNEAQKAATTYSQFRCIRELSEKLTATMHEIESSLDNSLASLTVVFDPDRYASSSARTVLTDRIHAQNADAINVDEMSYEQLCELIIKAVDAENMLECVREVGFVICKVLFTYHDILRYHIEEDERINCTQQNEEDIIGIVQQTLADSLYSIFKTASTKFNTLLCCHDLSMLKFDHFLDIVEMANRFKHFGRVYFGNSCGEVSISLEKQTHLYFGRYHRERMDELRMFLENEAFALCPVPLQFTVFDLQEFNFLKESSDCCDEDVEHEDVNDNAKLGEALDFEIIPPGTFNPFSQEAKQKTLEISTTSNMTKSSFDETDSEIASPMSATRMSMSGDTYAFILFEDWFVIYTLNIGRYIRMTYLLHSIAEHAITSITQLFNYFFFSVHSIFSSDGKNFDIQFCSTRLRTVLYKIREELIYSHESSPTEHQLRMYPCNLSPMVQLNYPDQIFALSERIVAVESLVFLAKQLDLIRPVIESLINSTKRCATLDYFYSKVLPVTVDVRECVYGCVASRALNYSQMISAVSSTKWDINELQSQHSGYVDFILQDMQNFAKRLKRIEESISVPKVVLSIIWDSVIHCSFKALVQGYSESGKRCTNEGRALMQLDLLQLISKLEQIIELRPIPHKSFVENYIKAYYLPEGSLEQWIQQHSVGYQIHFEYTANQMITLLNVATHVSKKARARLISALDE